MSPNGAGSSRFQILVALTVLVLLLILSALGIAINGLWGVLETRFWADIYDRTAGPLWFRVLLQPSMAVLAAILDGIRDLQERSKPQGPAPRLLLQRSFLGSARIVLIGIAVDFFYQLKTLDRLYPGEIVVVALALAFVPYVACRWVFVKMSRHATKP